MNILPQKKTFAELSLKQSKILKNIKILFFLICILGLSLTNIIGAIPAYADLQNAGSTLQGSTSDPTNNNIFDRNRAATWAMDNAEVQPPSSGSCTWFVSNALWQGGLAKTTDWTSDGTLGSTSNVFKRIYKDAHTLVYGPNLPGTIDAWNPVDLKNYLLQTYPDSTWTPVILSSTTNAVPQAQLGDLIFYDWGQGEGISHVAMVTKIEEPSQYPDVSEWSGMPQDSSLPETYQYRGWTFSQATNQWLQDEYHGTVTAYLLHVDTSVVAN